MSGGSLVARLQALGVLSEGDPRSQGGDTASVLKQLADNESYIGPATADREVSSLFRSLAGDREAWWGETLELTSATEEAMAPTNGATELSPAGASD